jgi:hypothetical protein
MTAKNVRLATWVAPDASKRLRMYATIRGLRLSDALTQVLRKSLPTAAELAEQMSGGTDDAV